MTLTREEEQALIEKHSASLWKCVHSFKINRTHDVLDREDLFQEAALVFLLHIRNAQSEKDIEIIPKKDILNAMCRHALKTRAYSYPVRTTDFSKNIRMENGARASFDEACEQEDPEQDFMPVLELNDFIDRLAKQKRDVLISRTGGEKSVDIAKRLGVTPAYVTKTVKQAAALWHDQAA